MKTSQAFFVSPHVSSPVKMTRLRAAARSSSLRCLGCLPEANSALRVLTPRQQEILREIAIGKGVKEISLKLGISPKTVETHRASLMNRLGIHRIPGLVRFALQTGVVPITWLLQRK